MIPTSLGTAASGAVGGGGAPCFTLVASFKKRKVKTIKNRRLRGSCVAGAVDARNQEMTGNFERPLDEKRGIDFNGEMISASLKQRSSNTAARENGIAIAVAAAADTSSPIVQELAGNRDGGNPICKNGRSLPWGSVGVAMDEKAEEKFHVLDGLRQDWEVSVLDFALPSRGVQNQKPLERNHHHHNGEKECWLIKRSSLATVAVCKGSNGAVPQNRVLPSAPFTGTQKPTRRSSPMQEAKADGRRSCKKAKHSARRSLTPMRPFVSLSSGLQCLGVTNVTPVLAKTLTATDCCLHQSRLQFSPRNVMESPLMSLLTPEEWRSVHNLDKVDGLELEAIDQHGYSYKMRLKYSDSARQYRLMQEWVLFLTRNGVRKGDVIEVGALLVQGRPILTLLNYSTATQGWIPEEIEAADGLLMLSDFRTEQGRKNSCAEHSLANDELDQFIVSSLNCSNQGKHFVNTSCLSIL